MTFEAFVTKLNGTFLVLSENERAYPEGKKIELIFRKVQTNHTKVHTMVSLIENDSTKYSTFTLGANALSESISKAPPALPYHKPKGPLGRQEFPKVEIIGNAKGMGQIKEMYPRNTNLTPWS